MVTPIAPSHWLLLLVGAPGEDLAGVALSLCGDNAIIKGRTGVTWLGRSSTGVETRLPGTTCGALPPTQVSNKQHCLPAPFPNAHCGPSRLRPIQPPERVMTSHKLRIYSTPHSPPLLPFPSLLIPSFFSLHPLSPSPSQSLPLPLSLSLPYTPRLRTLLIPLESLVSLPISTPTPATSARLSSSTSCLSPQRFSSLPTLTAFPGSISAALSLLLPVFLQCARFLPHFASCSPRASDPGPLQTPFLWEPLFSALPPLALRSRRRGESARRGHCIIFDATVFPRK